MINNFVAILAENAINQKVTLSDCKQTNKSSVKIGRAELTAEDAAAKLMNGNLPHRVFVFWLSRDSWRLLLTLVGAKIPGIAKICFFEKSLVLKLSYNF